MEKYDVGHRLGKGTFGKVFFAKNKDTSIVYAIKTVSHKEFF